MTKALPRRPYTQEGRCYAAGLELERYFHAKITDAYHELLNSKKKYGYELCFKFDGKNTPQWRFHGVYEELSVVEWGLYMNMIKAQNEYNHHRYDEHGNDRFYVHVEPGTLYQRTELGCVRI